MPSDPPHLRALLERRKANAKRRLTDYQWFLGPKSVIHHHLSQFEALSRCFSGLEQKRNVDLADAKILDVGSNNGRQGLGRLVGLGFSPKQMHGIEIMAEYVADGTEKYPGFSLHHGDATDMHMFDDEEFDIVMLQFCFSLIEDEEIRKSIANEMLRVTKVGGHILIFDWVMGRKSAYIVGVPLKKIKNYFGVGSRSQIVSRHLGPLWPPLGRPISKFVPFIYSIVQRFFPPAVGAKLTVLSRER